MIFVRIPLRAAALLLNPAHKRVYGCRVFGVAGVSEGDLCAGPGQRLGDGATDAVW